MKQITPYTHPDATGSGAVLSIDSPYKDEGICSCCGAMWENASNGIGMTDNEQQVSRMLSYDLGEARHDAVKLPNGETLHVVLAAEPFEEDDDDDNW